MTKIFEKTRRDFVNSLQRHGTSVWMPRVHVPLYFRYFGLQQQQELERIMGNTEDTNFRPRRGASLRGWGKLW